MQNSKVVQILRKLDTRERSRFREYVHSDFFNKHLKIRQLCDLLLEQAPNFESLNLSKQKIFAKLYPQQTFRATTFHNLVSNLLELLCDFLAWLEQNSSALSNKLHSLRALRKRGLDKQLQSTIRQHRLLQARNPFQDAELHFQQYLFYEELDAHFLSAPRRHYDENLQCKSDQLDLFYLSNKLKMACDMASRNTVINANYSCHLLPKLLSLIEEEPTYLEQPGIGIYYQILKMLTGNDEADYERLKILLRQNIEHFSISELQLMHDYAQNYCIRKINSGQTDYYQEFLNLYKFQLSKKILLRAGYLEEWDYKNIVTAGVRLKDYDWTAQFIEKNKQYLKPNVRENAHAYNLSNFYYVRGQHKKALRTLLTVGFTDTPYHLGAKIMQLKIYYELNEMEAFSALIDAFRLYLRRNKQVSDYRKTANLNFLKIAKKIGNLREQQEYVSKKKFQKLWQATQQASLQLSPLANSDWATEVLEALKVS